MLRSFAAVLTAAILAACAAVPLAPRDPHSFDLLGRARVAYGTGSTTANLRWEHTAREDQIWLMTPTGQTLAHIVDSAQGATLTRADRKQYRAGSVEALTQQALGWPLPLALLQYWVRGRPAPGSVPQSVERGPDNALVALTQNGWQVTFTYYSDGEMSGKVRTLDLNDGANQIRLVIDTWRDAQAL
jgi:outer membrane lipoprotein LolB